mgnify:CR=1 FL=1
MAVPELAYLNGRFLPISEAAVPIDDRGLLFGDSLYEVIRVYAGKFFRLDAHLARLEQGARAIELPIAVEELRAVLLELARRSGLGDAFVYLQVTRGVAPRNHVIPPDLEPTVLATVRPLVPLPAEQYEQGARAILRPDIRWGRRDIKATTLLPNILRKTEAARLGCYDVLHYEPDGTITEGSTCNIFGVFNGVLRTHPTGPRILAGITRGAVLDCARELGIPVEERPFTREEVPAAEELFFTDTYCEVLGIVEVDGQPIGQGRPGPLTRRLHAAFRRLVAREARAD